MLVTIRHGETNYNIEKIYSGKGNLAMLTNKGKEDAYNKGKELLDYNIDIALISPLTRAIDTFNELNKTLNIKDYKIIDELIERDYKEYEGKPYSVLDRSISWNRDLSHTLDIESIPELEKRIEKVLKLIKDEYKDKNVLIVAHAGVCRIIRHIMNNKKEVDLTKYDLSNLCVDVYKEW